MRFDSAADLDHALRSIRFSPRTSLEAEILWRARGLPPESPGIPALFLGLGLLLGLGLIGALVYIFWVALLNLGVTSQDLVRIYLA